MRVCECACACLGVCGWVLETESEEREREKRLKTLLLILTNPLSIKVSNWNKFKEGVKLLKKLYIFLDY